MLRIDRSRTTRFTSALITASIALPCFATNASAAAHAIGEMVAWAAWVDTLQRGPVDIANPGFGNASYGAEADVLGPALGDNLTVLSLGDGGFITLEFDDSIVDGVGDDFAVFENGFFDNGSGELFGEIAFVEVSTNGIDFARLSTDTTNATAVSGGGTIDPADYDGFAGLHPAGIGTGFDLAELVGHPLETQGLLDLRDVAFVRVVDVVGNGSTFDDAMNAVYDPYATAFASGGFDLDGVGALHVPEPSGALMLCAGLPGVALLARRRQRRIAPAARRARPPLDAALAGATSGRRR